MEVVYDGKELVEKWELDYGYDSSFSSGNAELLQIEKLLNYSFKPNYKVHTISKGSPAYLAGLRVGDQLLKIGNKSCFDLKLEDINGYFLKPRNKLKITYLRNYEEFVTTLKLVDIYPN
jgi:C-terminal processing protease CtpA/Prc